MEFIEARIGESGRGAFVLIVDGKELGHMNVERHGKTLTAIHTEVAKEAEGKGYARKILDAMVAYVRENQLFVKPLCPYVTSVFRRHPEEYKDLIDPAITG